MSHQSYLRNEWVATATLNGLSKHLSFTHLLAWVHLPDYQHSVWSLPTWLCQGSSGSSGPLSPPVPHPSTQSQSTPCPRARSPSHFSCAFVLLPIPLVCVVSLYINSVIVTSGMCINCDLPTLPPSLLPCFFLSSTPPPTPSLPVPNSTPTSTLLSPTILVFNPRMASITRTCWCVLVPWEWPPVLLPLWEASLAPLAWPRLLGPACFFCFVFFSPPH